MKTNLTTKCEPGTGKIFTEKRFLRKDIRYLVGGESLKILNDLIQFFKDLDFNISDNDIALFIMKTPDEAFSLLSDVIGSYITDNNVREKYLQIFSKAIFNIKYDI